jgi:hypothetical protein
MAYKVVGGGSIPRDPWHIMWFVFIWLQPYVIWLWWNIFVNLTCELWHWSYAIA